MPPGGEQVARLNTEGATEADWDHRRSQLLLSRKACELCIALGIGLALGMGVAWGAW